MLTTAAILGIVKTTLEITLEVIKGIPIEQREKFWNEHNARIEFWTKLIDRIGPDDKDDKQQ